MYRDRNNSPYLKPLAAYELQPLAYFCRISRRNIKLIANNRLILVFVHTIYLIEFKNEDHACIYKTIKQQNR